MCHRIRNWMTVIPNNHILGLYVLHKDYTIRKSLLLKIYLCTVTSGVVFTKSYITKSLTQSSIESSLLNAWKKTGTFCVLVALKLVISQSPFWNIRVLSTKASSIANVSEISCLS
jgi:hypothetical protein